MTSSRTDRHRQETLAEIVLLLLAGVVIVSLLGPELIALLVAPAGLVVIYLLYRLVTTAEEIAEKL